MRNGKNKVGAALLAALLLCTGAALGQEQPVEPDGLALRYTPVEGQQVVTLQEQPEQALQSLGVTAQSVLAAMEQDNCYMIVTAEDGSSVELQVLDAPEGITVQDVSGLDPQQRELLLSAVGKRLGAQNAEWSREQPDYVLCRAKTDTEPALDTLSLTTLYRGKLYSYRLETVGHAPAQEEEAQLLAVVKDALRLGAETEEEPLALPALPVLTQEKAELTVDQQGIAIHLEDVPAVVGSKLQTLRGTTEPGAKVRVKVGGGSGEWQEVGADGSFELAAPSLKEGQKNKVQVAAKKGSEVSTVSFVWTVEWQATPMALSKSQGFTYEDETFVSGITMPGSEVTLTKGSQKTKLEVDAEGRFSFSIGTVKTGNYRFSVRSIYDGYKRTEIEGMIRRSTPELAKSETDALNFILISGQPSAYAGEQVYFEGTAEELMYADGKPMCLLNAHGQKVVFQCGTLSSFHVGDTLNLLGYLTGESYTVRSARFPVASLQQIVP